MNYFWALKLATYQLPQNFLQETEQMLFRDQLLAQQLLLHFPSTQENYKIHTTLYFLQY